MKKNVLFMAVSIFMAWALNAQKVNDKIEIESKGSWYPGTILKVNAGEKKYFVTYEGWSESWNEWVGAERIRGYNTEEEPVKTALTKFKVGDRVEVEYGMIPAPATVTEVGENKYHIQFDKKSFGDKWVTEKQIKKL